MSTLWPRHELQSVSCGQPMRSSTRLTVLPNISAIFIDVLELPESLDDVDILARPGNDEFGAFVEAVVEDFERFKDMTPILALVVQSLVENVHYLVEGGGTAGTLELASQNRAIRVGRGRSIILCE
jgi:hypothetical protein